MMINNLRSAINDEIERITFSGGHESTEILDAASEMIELLVDVLSNFDGDRVAQVESIEKIESFLESNQIDELESK